jgi:hypothetical protein
VSLQVSGRTHVNIIDTVKDRCKLRSLARTHIHLHLAIKLPRPYLFCLLDSVAILINFLRTQRVATGCPLDLPVGHSQAG